MNPSNLISRLPFFGHLTEKEAASVSSLFSEVHIRTGDKLDLKKDSRFYLLSDGLIQSEGTLSRAESSYFASGSFFGSIPFVHESPRGIFRALTDSRLYSVTLEDMHRFLVSSFPALRGYLSIMKRSGGVPNDIAEKIYDRKSSVITISSRERNAGKTVSAVAIARILAKKSEVILLDLSCNGRSLFDYLGLKLTPPVSQKKLGEGRESYINERIIKKDERLSVLNVSFGSKVKMDAEILSPLICILSERFDYIIMDLGAEDPVIEKECCNISDIFVSVGKSRKNAERTRTHYDLLAESGQISHHLCFEKRALVVSRSEGRLWFSPPPDDLEDYASISEWSEVAVLDSFVDEVSRKKGLLFLRNTGYSSLGFASLVSSLTDEMRDSLTIYASSFAFLLFGLYAQDRGRYKKILRSSFSERKLLSIIDVVYPREYLLSDRIVRSFVSQFGKTMRLEDIHPQMVTAVRGSDGRIMVKSSGNFRDIAGALLSEYLLSESYRTRSGKISLPETDINPAFFFRRPYRFLSGAYLNPHAPILPRGKHRVIFQAGYGKDRAFPVEKWIFDDNIIIDVDDKSCTVKKILLGLKDEWESALSRLSKPRF
jgi:CRP-like cAMP-binding protein